MAEHLLPKKILLQIATPEGSVVEQEVEEVVLPGSLGCLGVLPGHTPLLTSLKIGEIKYRVGDKIKFLVVSWGFVEILPDRVTVLADVAERPEDIDVASAEEAKKRAEQMLREPDSDFRAAQAQLEQAIARIQVAGKKSAAAR
ncbi:MAG: F0F1 ATP synthase subunit epsilon [Acidobacteriota bacterium]|jgi:F-type H+-transporting ATPase subunit epsilon